MSNLRPRPPLPPPASPAICRVQPLVPELSLFVPGHGAPPAPPQPHLPPAHHLLPQSDLSRQFHRTEATLFLNGSNSDLLPRKVQWSDQQAETDTESLTLRQPPASPDSVSQQPQYAPQYQTPPAASSGAARTGEVLQSPVHPDILAVLNWQNEQLARLQDQVSRLLAASPSQSTSAAATTRDVAVGSPVLKRAATVSTNTSTCWPFSQGVIHGGEMELVSQTDTGGPFTNDRAVPATEVNTRESVGSDVTPVKALISERNTTTSATTRESVGNLVTPVKVGTEVGADWESPVLGESVSMYERESQLGSEREEQEMYENILGKVKRLLAQEETPPAPEQKEENSEEEEREETPNQTEATWQRLKQLGVSFISPADLAPAASPGEQQYNSVWLPQARLPSLHHTSASPDSSLAINNLALKYLSDQELAKLATLHNQKDKKGILRVSW